MDVVIRTVALRTVARRTVTLRSVALSAVAVPTAVSALVGLVCGVFWALLAPPEQFVVVAPDLGAALTGESLHRFDSVALFVCGALISGIVLPVLVWTWRSRRGPALFAGLLLGAGVGAGVMLAVGLWVAARLHPGAVGAQTGAVVSVAPGFESPLVLLVQPLVASLVVLLLAAMNPHDNLRYTPADESVDDTNSSVGADSAYADRGTP